MKASQVSRPAMALLILAMVYLSGCSLQDSTNANSSGLTTDFQGWVGLPTSDSAIRFAEENGYQLMADILEDGEVSRDEYTESFDSWASCMEKAGTVFSMPTAMWNPTDNRELIRAWAVNPPLETKDEQAACWDQLNFVKDEFQEQTTAHADPQLMTYVIDCIEATSGPANLTPSVDFTQLSLQSPELNGGNLDSPISDCVSEGVRELYPRLEGYSLAF